MARNNYFVICGIFSEICNAVISQVNLHHLVSIVIINQSVQQRHFVSYRHFMSFLEVFMINCEIMPFMGNYVMSKYIIKQRY